MTITILIAAILSLLWASIEFERAMRAKQFRERLEAALDAQGGDLKQKWFAPVSADELEEWRKGRWD